LLKLSLDSARLVRPIDAISQPSQHAKTVATRRLLGAHADMNMRFNRPLLRLPARLLLLIASTLLCFDFTRLGFAVIAAARAAPRAGTEWQTTANLRAFAVHG
jgi:hypothetical protein